MLEEVDFVVPMTLPLQELCMVSVCGMNMPTNSNLEPFGSFAIYYITAPFTRVNSRFGVSPIKTT